MLIKAASFQVSFLRYEICATNCSSGLNCTSPLPRTNKHHQFKTRKIVADAPRSRIFCNRNMNMLWPCNGLSDICFPFSDPLITIIYSQKKYIQRFFAFVVSAAISALLLLLLAKIPKMWIFFFFICGCHYHIYVNIKFLKFRLIFSLIFSWSMIFNIVKFPPSC